MPRGAGADRDDADRDDGGQRRALVGALVALPVLAVVVVGAGADRPPATSDGVWTTPLQVVLGVAAVAALVAIVLVVRGMEVDAVRPGVRGQRSRALVVFALLVVAIVAAPRLEVELLPPGSGPFSFGPAPGGAARPVDPLPISPTAVVAGLAALALAAVGGFLVLRRGTATAPAVGDTSEPAGAGPGAPHALPFDGPPDAVVLAAYAAARHEAIRRLGTGEQDPPGRLVRRARSTDMADALQHVTELYLPVRYGRRHATTADADAAVAALERLRAAPPGQLRATPPATARGG